MLLIFNLIFIFIKRLKNSRLYHENNKLESILKTELDNYNPNKGLSTELKEILRNKTSSTKNLIIVQNEFEKPRKYRKQLKDEARPYVFNQINNYQKANDYEQAYYAYVISTFDYEELELKDKFYVDFLRFLDSKSLYVYSNAMDAIYKFADPHIMSIAIKKIDEREGFYHSKLFVDGLLDFKGDVEVLHNMLIGKFYNYSGRMHKSLIDYFRIKDVDIKEFALKIIEERKLDDEVIYSAMRYFRKNPNEESKNIFIEILKNDENFWIDQLLAIQSLESYKDPLVRSLIKDKITSENWNIRTNSIAYLHKHGLTKEEIYGILALRDKYTNETLLYYYKDDQEISQYIINVLEKMNRGDKKSEESLKPGFLV